MEAQYSGYDVDIHEWPSGCEIVSRRDMGSVALRCLEDVRAVHESLGRYIEMVEEDTQ